MPKRNKFLDMAMKQAELMLENQQFISKLLDDAFVKMGQATEVLYDIQDQTMALLRMIASWVKRDYTDVSPKTIVALLAAVIYFVNPFDLISDFIPFIGLLDDFSILSYAITVFNKEIERFMDWEREQAFGATEQI